MYSISFVCGRKSECQRSENILLKGTGVIYLKATNLYLYFILAHNSGFGIPADFKKLYVHGDHYHNPTKYHLCTYKSLIIRLQTNLKLLISFCLGFFEYFITLNFILHIRKIRLERIDSKLLIIFKIFFLNSVIDNKNYTCKMFDIKLITNFKVKMVLNFNI